MTKPDHPAVTDVVGSIPKAIAIVEAAGGKGRYARCSEYGTPGTHFLVWPNTSGVDLRTMTCPVHGGRWVTQTNVHSAGPAWVITKDYVAAIGRAVTAAKRAKQAERVEAGDAVLARDLVAGDTVRRSASRFSRSTVPTWQDLKVVEVERIAGGKVRLAVVGPRDELLRRSGIYRVSGYGLERDLVVVEPVWVVELAGSAEFTRRSAEDLAGVTFADPAEATVLELEHLAKVAAARREYLADRRADLEAKRAKAVEFAELGGYAGNRALAEERHARDIARREDDVERFVAELEAIDARIAELRVALGITDGPEAEEALAGVLDDFAEALGGATVAHLPTPACTGTSYPVNPDFPEEGLDVHHEGPCPAHPDATPAIGDVWPDVDGLTCEQAGCTAALRFAEEGPVDVVEHRSACAVAWVTDRAAAEAGLDVVVAGELEPTNAAQVLADGIAHELGTVAPWRTAGIGEAQ